MVEGRCALSSYVTGESPNTHGVCSPAKSVRWQQTDKGLESRLNGVLIDRYADGENAGYPTLCKGRFDVARSEEHTSELQSLMRISYAVFCLKKKKQIKIKQIIT